VSINIVDCTNNECKTLNHLNQHHYICCASTSCAQMCERLGGHEYKNALGFEGFK